MKKNNWILPIFLIIGIIFSCVTLVYQTNLFYAHAGGEFSREISIPYIGEDNQEVVLIKLKRSAETPGVMDFAKFDNGEQFIYKTIDEGDVIFTKIYITLPNDMEKGKYYIDYQIKVDSEIVNGELSFLVI